MSLEHFSSSKERFQPFLNFRNLADLFPQAQSLVDVINNNREVWKLARNLFQEYSQKGSKSMDILLDPSLEDEVLSRAVRQNTEFEDEPSSEVTIVTSKE